MPEMHYLATHKPRFQDEYRVLGVVVAEDLIEAEEKAVDQLSDIAREYYERAKEQQKSELCDIKLYTLGIGYDTETGVIKGTKIRSLEEASGQVTLDKADGPPVGWHEVEDKETE